ncbi:DNA-directed RNA polymerase subunit delta [Oceanobacillus arenosus]|uniref:Probable DNA-directed RNA polymerase subunit delta n=1 Tax=Oceanobacillus arenosus TaxID=1229153 RepID=A0A3D8Q3I0_9BACI|nr:DNA-directed RNA polymerase subunit delta [Oceanobacillus arenosus]RDW22289.1 DNA-directed RNA polymerase subunit delta [Oceanobacillus arenosus]
MSLKDLSHEEIKSISLIELTGMILKEEKKALHFNEIFDRISELRGFTKKEKEKKIAQFYTDMNIDGRFTTIGSNMWGLRSWYPVEQQDEEVHVPVKKKKTTAKKKTPIEKDAAFDDELGELDDEDDLDLDEVLDDEDLDIDDENLDDFDEDFDDDDDDDDDDDVDVDEEE